MSEKRFAIYLIVRRFLAEVFAKVQEAGFPAGIQFIQETKEAEFLFAPDIEKFIREIYSNATHLRGVNEILRQSTDRERSLEQERLELWLAVDAHEQAKQKFTPYLKLYD